MRFSLRDLKKWTVKTVSGQKLGHVSDVVVETEGQLIAQYLVKEAMIGGAMYTVSRDQVVRFEERTLVVDDAVARDNESEVTKTPPIPDAEPVAMRES